MTRRLDRGTRLIIATHNPGKLREMDDLLRPYALEAISAGALGLTEPAEDAQDFAGNARIKALTAASTGSPALADDSGFCVAALAGSPGVLSARWAGASKDFTAAIQRVQDEMGATTDRRAWFISALCLAWPDGETATFIGRVDGTVAPMSRGTLGFGYDPIFIPAGGRLTYGEIEPSQKHATSHRAQAMAQLIAACFPGARCPTLTL
jgi:XTP/dITP diphosphohydrolase